MDVTLRDCTEADMAVVQAIYAGHVLHGKGSFEEVPPDLNEMLQRRTAIVSRKLPYLVAEMDGRVIGYAYASLYRPRSAYRFTVEDSIYLAPEASGKGVGGKLLAEVIQRCTDQGYREMIAVIGDSANAASIGLHAHAGFRHAGTLERVGFKFGQWIDSVVMQRSLHSVK